MMNRCAGRGFIVIAAILFGVGQANTLTPVSSEQQSEWINWLIPLPKEIAIEQKVVLAADGVGLQLTPSASDVETNAAQLLIDLFQEKAQSDLTGSRFVILMGLIDGQGFLDDLDLSEAADVLGMLANCDQAYVIRPDGDSRLVLAALNERGLYYGAQTLCQLLESAFDQDDVSIPLAEVTDWPDLEERGYWEEGFTAEQLTRMASLKYNTANVLSSLGFDTSGNAIVKQIPKDVWDLESDFSTYCHLNAISCIPIIQHLSQLKRTGIYDYYPELLGQGDSATMANHSSWQAPCASHPEFAQILADWMSRMADTADVDEVAVWLTEDYVYCSCSNCLEKGQYVAEAMAIADAWEIAKHDHPDLKVQILLTQGSYSTNDQVLAAVGDDMRIIYYDGSRTYNSSREPMIYPLLEDFAAGGGWLSVCPQTTVSWASIIPWSCPQFIKARMAEFVDKNLHGVMGYSHPSIDPYDFNVAAAAEWSWNATGRDEQQFALAWATRKGFDNPQAVADWIMTLGPVSWNLYGSSFPYNLLWIDPADLVDNRTEPEWETDIFRYFENAGDLDDNIQTCTEALGMAELLDDPEFVEENQIALDFYNMLKAISQIMTCCAQNNPLTPTSIELLQEYSQQLDQSIDNIADILPQWGARYDLPADSGRIKNTITDNQNIVNAITSAVDDLIATEAGYFIPPAEAVNIDKITVKAGKTRSACADSIIISGSSCHCEVSDFDGADFIYIELGNEGADIPVFSGEFSINAGKMNNGIYKYISREDGFRSLMFNQSKGSFSITAKNIDLTGLQSPVQLKIGIDDYYGVGYADNEALSSLPDYIPDSLDMPFHYIGDINRNKSIPVQLMTGYQDTLGVDKCTLRLGTRKPNTDSLTIQGAIAIEDTSLNIANEDVIIHWGDYSAILPAEDLYPMGSRQVFKYKKPRGSDGTVAAALFDLDKCRFKITIKKAAIGLADNSVNFEIEIGDDHFDQTVPLELTEKNATLFVFP